MLPQRFGLCMASALIISVFAVAWGGGGSSGDGIDDDQDVAGVWKGALTLLRDDCSLDIPATINAVHTINQDGEVVALTTEDNTQLIGSFENDNSESFDVGTILTDPAPPAADCNLDIRIRYDDISGDTANVGIRVVRSCSGTDQCATELAGALRREESPAAADPTPTPTPAIPNDGIACSQIIERSYSGDGGCGLNEVEFSQSGANFVLEPFGVNGATSFAPVAGSSEQAQSLRSDLIISELPGYSCSLSCLGELTFEVECFVEGGQTCTEKF